MLRRVVGIVLVVLGALAVTLGVLSATQWRTSEEVTATTPTTEVPFVVIEPGVAGIVNRVVDVEITAADPEQTVTVITGRDVDINAWLGDTEVLRITGLADWEELTTQVGPMPTPEATPSPEATQEGEVAPEGEATSDGEAAGEEGEAAGEGEASPDGEAAPEEGEETAEGEGEATAEIPDPVGNDMWWSTQQEQGSFEETWTVPEDRTEVLIVRGAAEGNAPTVSFTWHREVTTPYLLPLVAGGALAIVLGLGMVFSSLMARKAPAPASATAASADGEAADGEPTSASSDEAEPREPQTDPDGEPDALPRPPQRVSAAEAALAAKAAVDSPDSEDSSLTNTMADETQILTRRQLRALREAGQRRAAAEMAKSVEPGTAVPATPEPPDAYPSWLRPAAPEAESAPPSPPADSTEVFDPVPPEPDPAHEDAAPPGEVLPPPPTTPPATSAEAWRRRWGVVSSQDETDQEQEER